MDTILSLNNISFSYRSDSGSYDVVKKLNLQIAKNSNYSLIGRNGSGKSTLTKLILGLIRPTEGTIRYYPQNNKNKIIPIVFQDYKASLLPWYNIRKNISYPLLMAGVPTKEIDLRLSELMKLTNTNVKLTSMPHELSGGQSQMVCLMRALIIKPELIIFDEPFSALDFMSRIRMQELVFRITKQMKMSSLFISHDIDEAIFLGNKVGFLAGKPSEIKEEVDILLPNKRTYEIQTSKEYIEIKEKVIRKAKEKY